jgi:hypothetical protein
MSVDKVENMLLKFEKMKFGSTKWQKSLFTIRNRAFHSFFIKKHPDSYEPGLFYSDELWVMSLNLRLWRDY